jgi:hypothetical protein
MQTMIKGNSIVYAFFMFFVAFFMSASVCDAQSYREKGRSELSGESSLISMNINLDYDILKRSITPILSCLHP